MIVTLFVGVGVAIGQVALNLLRSALSITDVGIVNLLAFLLVVPAVYFAYWMYIRLMGKRDLTELRGAKRRSGIRARFVDRLWAVWLRHGDFVGDGFYRDERKQRCVAIYGGCVGGRFVSALAQELIFRERI